MAKKPVSGESYLKFLENRQVLVVDPNIVYRNAIRKSIQQLGIKAGSIEAREDFVGAQGAIKQRAPDILFIELDLGKKTGLDVLQFYRTLRKDRLDDAIFMLSARPSPEIGSLLSEGIIDGFLTKPLTAESIMNLLKSVADRKAKPTDHEIWTSKGALYLEDKALDKAVAAFDLAISFGKRATKKAENGSGKKPNLATTYGYLGQTYLIQGEKKKAEENFIFGLTEDDRNFLCLAGLTDLYGSQAQYERAHSYLKKILDQFPVSQERMVDWTRICVYSGNPQDVMKLANLCQVMTLPVQDEVRKAVSAGMVIHARKLIQVRNIGEALKVLKRVIPMAAGFEVILRQALVALKSTDQYAEYEAAVKNLPEEFTDRKEFLLIEIEAACRSKNYGYAYQKAREAILLGLKGEDIKRLVMTAGKGVGRNEGELEDLVTRV